MKYLLVALVVLAGIWLWRHNRSSSNGDSADAPASRQAPPTPKPPAAPAPMVACRHCGLHLPQGDATTGRHGVYCTAEHRRLSEGA